MRGRMFYRQLILEMKLFVRDRQSVFWAFFFPVLLILLFGFIFGQPNAIQFGVGFVDEDNSTQSQAVSNMLESIPVLKVEHGERDALLEKVKNNQKNAVILVGKGYSDSLRSGNAAIEVVYDETNPQFQQVVSAILREVVNAENWRLVAVKPAIRIESISLVPERTDTRYIDFLLPGVIGMTVVSTCLFSIGMVVVAYREKGKLRRLSVTPLPKPIFIAGQMVNRYFIVLAQASVLIGLGAGIFQVHMRGSFFDFFCALTVGMLCFISIGFLVASVAKTTETAAGIANSIFLPMMFLSGVYFPMENAPKLLRPLIEFLPLTHLVKAIRDIFNNGEVFGNVLPQMGILTIWTLICFTISSRLFKWD